MENNTDLMKNLTGEVKYSTFKRKKNLAEQLVKEYFHELNILERVIDEQVRQQGTCPDYIFKLRYPELEEKGITRSNTKRLGILLRKLSLEIESSIE